MLTSSSIVTTSTSAAEILMLDSVLIKDVTRLRDETKGEGKHLVVAPGCDFLVIDGLLK